MAEAVTLPCTRQATISMLLPWTFPVTCPQMRTLPFASISPFISPSISTCPSDEIVPVIDVPAETVVFCIPLAAGAGLAAGSSAAGSSTAGAWRRSFLPPSFTASMLNPPKADRATGAIRPMPNRLFRVASIRFTLMLTILSFPFSNPCRTRPPPAGGKRPRAPAAGRYREPGAP